MSIHWREDLATGNNEIDQHYKELFQKINALVAACKERREKTVVLDLFGFLQSSVQNHFAAEEQFITKYQSTNAQEHHRQHNKLVAECSQDGATLSMVTNSLKLTYLLLRDHIQQMDLVMVSTKGGYKPC